MKRKKNIVIIISHVFKSFEFEWTAEYINKEKFNLFFVLLNPGDSSFEKHLRNNNINVTRIKYNDKKDFVPALFKTFFFIRKIKADIVHTHLFDAAIIGLLAAKFAGVKRRINTRHNSTLYHVYYPHLIKYIKLINLLSTNIIAISNVVKEVLIKKENVNEKKITLIYHGFNINEFENVSSEKVNLLNNKYNPNNNKPVIGVISRYLPSKGIQYIIPAFKKILQNYPNALLILANAHGTYESEVHLLLKEIPKHNYREILFEEDLFSFYKLFDVFIHVPINNHIEAFGQIYVEALAAGIPSIVTLSGIANEFIKDKHNALVVPYEDSDSIYKAILELLNNDTLKKNISLHGKEEVEQLFPIHKMIQGLEKLYQQEL